MELWTILKVSPRPDYKKMKQKLNEIQEKVNKTKVTWNTIQAKNIKVPLKLKAVYIKYLISICNERNYGIELLK